MGILDILRDNGILGRVTHTRKDEFLVVGEERMRLTQPHGAGAGGGGVSIMLGRP